MEDYEIDIDKECPRCGSKKVAVKVFQGWTFQSHSPMCAGCGLGAGKIKRVCTSKIIALAEIVNFYYEYEPRQLLS
jgi:hypothetical protein